MAITQGASGKYYCKIAGSPPLVCKSPDQPTGADCGTLPPTGEQACSYGNPRVYGRVEKQRLLQRFTATTSWKGFVNGEMPAQSYFMLAGGAVIGALAARKLIKKGNKKTNTVIGGIVGLIAGYGATKIIK